MIGVFLVDSWCWVPSLLILAIIVFGMVIGAGAQFILRRKKGRADWTMAFVAGIAGSSVAC